MTGRLFTQRPNVNGVDVALAGEQGKITRVTRSSNTILGVADLGKFFEFTASFTQTLTAAATLGAGWWCYLYSTNNVLATIDPNGSETVDGSTTAFVKNQTRLLFCDGSNFFTYILEDTPIIRVVEGIPTGAPATTLTGREMPIAFDDVFKEPYLWNGTTWNRIGIGHHIFPTTPVLDNFDRANEGPPPSSSWTSGFYMFGNALKVVSNKLSGVSAWDSDVYWNPTTFGPDCEGYCEFKDAFGSQADVYIGLRLTTPGSGTTDGYMVAWTSLFSEVKIYRIDNGVLTQLGASVPFNNGINFPARVGARIVGSKITVWQQFHVSHEPSYKSLWVELAGSSRTDATYSSAGYVGFGIPNINPEQLDFVGGGTYVPDTVGFIPNTYLDTDGTLAANSDEKVASQKAVKTYVGTSVAALIHAATGKTTPVDADELGLADSAASFVLKKLTWANLKATLKTYFDTLYPSGSGTSTGTNTGDQTSVSGNAGTATTLQNARTIDGQSFNGSANITVIAPGTHAASSKTTPVNADELPLVDTEASNVLKRLTLTNLKAFLKTYFDTLYPSGSGTSSGTNTGDQTTVSGNAGTATTLQTARNIDGQSFNGSADITVIAPGTHAASSKATPVDADEIPLVDSAASNVLKKLTWANLKTTLNAIYDWATVTHAAASKTTPVDADELSIVDSAASNVIKRLTWANLKATLKTYFDTFYPKQTDSKTLTTQPAIANTETVVISYTCAANELAVGTTFRFKAFATRAGANSSSQVIRIRVGTTTLTGNIAATLTPPAAAVASPIEIEGLVTVITNGGSGTIRGSLRCLTHLAAVTVSPAIASTTAVAVDTTAANMLIELTFISGNASNTYTFQNVTLEKVVA